MQKMPGWRVLRLATFGCFASIASGAAQGPSFVDPPRDQLVRRGDTATISANAVGGLPLSFQWRFNGNDLAFATNSSLVLTNISPAQEGRYSVRVSNAIDSVESEDARLTVCWDVFFGPVERISGPPDSRIGRLLGYDAAGNVYIIHDLPSASTNSQWNGFALEKLAPSHEKVWEARYAHPNPDASFVGRFSSFNIENSESTWVAGVAHVKDEPGLLTVIHFDPAGKITRIAEYPGTPYPANVVVNDRDDVFLVPEWEPFRNQDFTVVKYAPSGAESWRDTIESTKFPDRLTAAAAVAGRDGAVFAAATLNIGPTGDTVLILCKV